MNSPHSEIDKKIQNVLNSKENNFLNLVKISGLNPKKDFRYVNLSGIDFSRLDLAGFDFTGSIFIGCKFNGAKIRQATFSNNQGLNGELKSSLDWSYYSSFRPRQYIKKSSRDIRVPKVNLDKIVSLQKKINHAKTQTVKNRYFKLLKKMADVTFDIYGPSHEITIHSLCEILIEFSKFDLFYEAKDYNNIIKEKGNMYKFEFLSKVHMNTARCIYNVSYDNSKEFKLLVDRTIENIKNIEDESLQINALHYFCRLYPTVMHSRKIKNNSKTLFKIAPKILIIISSIEGNIGSFVSLCKKFFENYKSLGYLELANDFLQYPLNINPEDGQISIVELERIQTKIAKNLSQIREFDESNIYYFKVLKSMLWNRKFNLDRGAKFVFEIGENYLSLRQLSYQTELEYEWDLFREEQKAVFEKKRPKPQCSSRFIELIQKGSSKPHNFRSTF